MLSYLLLCAHWLLPFGALGAFFVFLLAPKKRISSSFIFAIFSLLTYQTHIVPYTLDEKTYNVQVSEESSLETDQDIKWGVLNQYASSSLRNEQFLENLWRDLSAKGFSGLIVREIPLSLAGDGQSTENLRIFRRESLLDQNFVLALSRGEVLAEQSKGTSDPVVWIDMSPMEWENSPYLLGDVWTSDARDWDAGIGVMDGEVIRLPFQSLDPDWYSFVSNLDMTVFHFYL